MLLFRSLIQEATQVGEARRFSKRQALELGFSESAAERVAIVVSEAASNLTKHTLGKGGELIVQQSQLSSGPAVDIWALDKGPGINNLAVSLTDGASSAGSAGVGLGGIRRLANVFDIYSQAGRGTVLFARINKEGVKPSFWQVAGINVPMKMEEVSGDTFAARESPGVLDLLVADGLGHGPLANEAAMEADTVFRGSGLTDTLSDILLSIHGALKKTRGAAVALSRIPNEPNQKIKFVGIGNIAAKVLLGEESRSMVSLSGIAGHECRKIQEFQYDFSPRSIFVMHSDGLQTRWDMSSYPALANRHAGVIAGVLYRDFTRGRDDSTVVVARRERQ